MKKGKGEVRRKRARRKNEDEKRAGRLQESGERVKEERKEGCWSRRKKGCRAEKGERKIERQKKGRLNEGGEE